MLTICAMAEMGPWTLLHIEDHRRVCQRCERCERELRYVYVLEKQTEPKVIARIGSVCGPQLEDLSHELWDATVKRFDNWIRLLGALDKLEGLEHSHRAEAPDDYPFGQAAEWREELLAGFKTEGRRKGMTSQTNKLLERWARAIDSPPKLRPEARQILRAVAAATSPVTAGELASQLRLLERIHVAPVLEFALARGIVATQGTAAERQFTITPAGQALIQR